MHLNRGLLNWGVFFILLGAIPLAVRQGVLSEEAVGRAWTLWPLLLIAAGIGLLLRRTALEFAGGLITAATLGIIGGGLLASGGIPFGSCGDEQGARAFPTQQGRLADAATVNVRLNCGELTIATGLGFWRVDGVDEDGSGPQVEVSGSGLAASGLEISSDERSGFNFFGSRARWAVIIPTGSKIDLEASLNAGEARLQLGDANLGRLRVEVNAGDARIDLGAVGAIESLEVSLNAGDARIELPNLGLFATVEANAASVRLCPPSGATLRVRLDDNITASNNFAARGLVEASEDVWETPGFAAAAVRLEIDAKVNAGSLNVEPPGTCSG